MLSSFFALMLPIRSHSQWKLQLACILSLQYLCHVTKGQSKLSHAPCYQQRSDCHNRFREGVLHCMQPAENRSVSLISTNVFVEVPIKQAGKMVVGLFFLKTSGSRCRHAVGTTWLYAYSLCCHKYIKATVLFGALFHRMVRSLSLNRFDFRR